MAVTFGVIIAVTAAALILALESGRQNTIELVRDRSERIIDTIVERTRLHLDPARDQSEFLARLFRDGDLDPQNEATLLSQLRAALAGIPQIAALAVIRTDLKQLRVERHGDDVVMRTIDMQTVPGLDEAFEMAQSAGRPVWGELLWSERLNQPLVNVRTPLWHERSFLGILVTTVTVAELSRFLAELPAGSNVGAFILLGRNHVLAHAALAHNPQLFKRDKPLPEVSEIGDPVLASIWSPDLEDGRGRVCQVLRKAISSLSITFPMSSSTATSRDTATSLGWSAAICRSTNLAAKSADLSTRPGWGLRPSLLRSPAPGWSAMRLESRYCGLHAQHPQFALSISRLPARSPAVGFANWTRQSGAYNALIATLHWFETYVPRRLVKQLMAQGEQATALVEREVTVLFTDIVDFTSLAERLSASDAATFLNDHFRLLAACVEAEGGTIDKYIGDSLMAFWGAPELQMDHSARACRAASSDRGRDRW